MMYNKSGIRHLITLIIKSTCCTVAKFIPEVCASVNLVGYVLSKYSTKQQTFAQLRSIQTSNI